MSEAKLPLPVIPRTFYAAGPNYRAHIGRANSRGAGHKVPTHPEIADRKDVGKREGS